MFKKIPGTKDILPSETIFWQKIEAVARNVFSFYNYAEIRTPIMEDAKLFNRTLGQTSEIIKKQMFLIQNQEDTYALRPEGTAAIVRSYLENNLDKTTGFAKFYYIGPMFRLERPQKGRLRQFQHIGCEAIGAQDATLDIEIIALADQLLKSLKIQDYKIKINSLGCSKDKEKFTQALKKELNVKASQFCPDCQERLKSNTLRVLDCKKATCQEILAALGPRQEHLCADCAAHFQIVKTGLTALKINFEISPQLVRGLDYYNRTVFEITHPNLGSQDAIGAGGRYNNLVQELGGPDLGGMGFAFGVERLILAAKTFTQEISQKKLVYLITLGASAKIAGLEILARLRQAGISSDTDYLNKSLKGAMRAANDAGANFVLILGDDELKKNSIMLKDMLQSTQKEIAQSNLIEELKC